VIILPLNAKTKVVKIENKIAAEIVDTAYHVHVGLGPGLFESVYEEIMFKELYDRGLKVERQVSVPVCWKHQEIFTGFRIDLLVEKSVLIEIKSLSKMLRVHQKQVHTYLKLADLKLGLLINFNEYFIKNGIQRIVNGL
jgi:GxxExxY protein